MFITLREFLTFNTIGWSHTFTGGDKSSDTSVKPYSIKKQLELFQIQINIVSHFVYINFGAK